MKRLTFCLALLALLIAGTVGAYRIIEVPEVGARTITMVMGGVAAAPSCSTAQDAETDASGGTENVGGADAADWLATGFVAGSTEDDQSAGDDNYTVCKAVVRGYVTDVTTTLNISACIYADSAGSPGEPGLVVGTCSDAVAGNTIGTSEQDITFVNMSAPVVNGTLYYLVLKTDTTDNSKYFKINKESNAHTEDIEYSADGVDGNWTNLSQVYSLKYTLYSE